MINYKKNTVFRFFYDLKIKNILIKNIFNSKNQAFEDDEIKKV